ncbi:MAG: hypothetical protein LBS76_02465 [Mycoplasmataceae bacterium]|jgi:hypothetical protein|nr:hypothetical protein [Mycoplasmataceae bacterium]
MFNIIYDAFKLGVKATYVVTKLSCKAIYKTGKFTAKQIKKHHTNTSIVKNNDKVINENSTE